MVFPFKSILVLQVGGVQIVVGTLVTFFDCISFHHISTSQTMHLSNWYSLVANIASSRSQMDLSSSSSSRLVHTLQFEPMTCQNFLVNVGSWFDIVEVDMPCNLKILSMNTWETMKGINGFDKEQKWAYLGRLSTTTMMSNLLLTF